MKMRNKEIYLNDSKFNFKRLFENSNRYELERAGQINHNEYRHLIVDFDSTIANSQEAFCKVYNELFKNHKGFTPADWTKIERWDMKDQCTLLTDDVNTKTLFSMKAFFDVVELYDGAKEVLDEISKYTDVVICSAGTSGNIVHKVLWLEKHLPFADIVPVIIKKSNGYGKKIINMEGAVFIDDHAHNLRESNADFKIMYGKSFAWNSNWTGMWFKEWSQQTKNFLLSALYKGNTNDRDVALR